MTKQNEFIESLDGELTTEQVAELIGFGEGDTGDKPETDDLPEVVTGKDDSATSEESANDEAQDPANSVILAKDGVHTIPYQKLTDEREAKNYWKAQAEEVAAKAAEREAALRLEFESLRAQAQHRADTGQEATEVDKQVEAVQEAMDQGVDIFGDFSEEGIAKGVNQLVQEGIQKAIAEMMKPVEQERANVARSAHYDAIYGAHPDADSIHESKELQDWINAQPSFVRNGYSSLFQTGTTEEIIELFDRFKQDTGITQPASDVRSAAKAVIDRATHQAPSSLSDFPGARRGATSKTEAMDDMDGAQLIDAMDDLSGEQLEQFLNRL